MQRLIERCTGLDVHRDTVAACAHARRRRLPGAGGAHFMQVALSEPRIERQEPTR